MWPWFGSGPRATYHAPLPRIQPLPYLLPCHNVIDVLKLYLPFFIRWPPPLPQLLLLMMIILHSSWPSLNGPGHRIHRQTSHHRHVFPPSRFYVHHASFVLLPNLLVLPLLLRRALTRVSVVKNDTRHLLTLSLQDIMNLWQKLSLSSSKTNHSPSNTQHLQHQIRPRPLPHLHLQRSHNVFQRSPLQFTKRPSLQFLWGNVYGYDTNLDCGDYDLDLWRRRRNQGEKEEECDDRAYGGGLLGVFDLFACGILWWVRPDSKWHNLSHGLVVLFTIYCLVAFAVCFSFYIFFCSHSNIYILTSLFGVSSDIIHKTPTQKSWHKIQSTS